MKSEYQTDHNRRAELDRSVAQAYRQEETRRRLERAHRTAINQINGMFSELDFGEGNDSNYGEGQA